MSSDNSTNAMVSGSSDLDLEIELHTEVFKRLSNILLPPTKTEAASNVTVQHHPNFEVEGTINVMYNKKPRLLEVVWLSNSKHFFLKKDLSRTNIATEADFVQQLLEIDIRTEAKHQMVLAIKLALGVILMLFTLLTLRKSSIEDSSLLSFLWGIVAIIAVIASGLAGNSWTRSRKLMSYLKPRTVIT